MPMTIEPGLLIAVQLNQPVQNAASVVTGSWILTLLVLGLLGAALIFVSLWYAKKRREQRAANPRRDKTRDWTEVLAYVLFTIGYWIFLGWLVYVVAMLWPGGGNDELVAHTLWKLFVLLVALYIAFRLVYPGDDDDENDDSGSGGVHGRRRGEPDDADAATADTQGA